MVRSLKDIYRCVVCGKYVETPTHCGKKAKLVLNGSRRVALSKLISFILRHGPEEAGIKLSRDGWVRISDLVYGIKNVWRNKHLYQWVTKEHIVALATLDPKGRFEVRRGMIRARYGHSRGVSVVIKYEEDREVKALYHGTSLSNLSSILKEGIKPMRRHYVHLSVSVEDACLVGRRHGGRAVFLEVDADCLRGFGLKVLKATNKVWLVKYVPKECLVRYEYCKD